MKWPWTIWRERRIAAAIAIVNSAKVTREEDVLLYVMGTLEGLTAKRLMHRSGPPAVTPQGMARYRALLTIGWKPTRREVTECLASMAQSCPVKEPK